MEDKIKIEESFLETTESLITDLLEQHFLNSTCKVDAFTKSNMKGLVKRVIIQEVEYLNQDPENYFSIYGEDHLDN